MSRLKAKSPSLSVCSLQFPHACVLPVDWDCIVLLAYDVKAGNVSPSWTGDPRPERVCDL